MPHLSAAEANQLDQRLTASQDAGAHLESTSAAKGHSSSSAKIPESVVKDVVKRLEVCEEQGMLALGEVGSCRQDCDRLEHMVQDLSTYCGSLQDKADTLTRSCREQGNDLVSLAQELGAHCESLQEKADSLTRSCTEYGSDLVSLKAGKDTLEGRLDDLERAYIDTAAASKDLGASAAVPARVHAIAVPSDAEAAAEVNAEDITRFAVVATGASMDDRHPRRWLQSKDGDIGTALDDWSNLYGEALSAVRARARVARARLAQEDHT